MEEKDIITGNKLISEFIGRYKKDEDITQCEDEIVVNVEYDGFSGAERKRTTRPFSYSDLRYHSSWEWLMPVVEKIATCYYKNFPINITVSGGSGAYISINPHNCAGETYDGDRLISDTMNLNYDIVNEDEKIDIITATYMAVVRFIKWYNEQQS